MASTQTKLVWRINKNVGPTFNIHIFFARSPPTGKVTEFFEWLNFKSFFEIESWFCPDCALSVELSPALPAGRVWIIALLEIPFPIAKQAVVPTAIILPPLFLVSIISSIHFLKLNNAPYASCDQ